MQDGEQSSSMLVVSGFKFRKSITANQSISAFLEGIFAEYLIESSQYLIAFMAVFLFSCQPMPYDAKCPHSEGVCIMVCPLDIGFDSYNSTWL